MSSLNTTEEHRRTRATIGQIIKDITPENRFHITVASSNRNGQGQSQAINNNYPNSNRGSYQPNRYNNSNYSRNFNSPYYGANNQRQGRYINYSNSDQGQTYVKSDNPYYGGRPRHFVRNEYPSTTSIQPQSNRFANTEQRPARSTRTVRTVQTVQTAPGTYNMNDQTFIRNTGQDSVRRIVRNTGQNSGVVGQSRQQN